MIRSLGLALLLLLMGLVPAWAWDPDAVFGAWWTPKHDGVVDITSCGGGLCGTVIGVTHLRPDGTAELNVQGRSRCHLRIIEGGSLNEDGVWNSHITNPDDGKRYTIQLRVDEDGRLRMRGYIGITLFGQTVYWERFDGHVTPECHVGE